MEGSKYTWFSESIELRGISSNGLKHIVEFMYSGKLPINMQSVQDILAVARHMQVGAVPNPTYSDSGFLGTPDLTVEAGTFPKSVGRRIF